MLQAQQAQEEAKERESRRAWIMQYMEDSESDSEEGGGSDSGQASTCEPRGCACMPPRHGYA